MIFRAVLHAGSGSKTVKTSFSFVKMLDLPPWSNVGIIVFHTFLPICLFLCLFVCDCLVVTVSVCRCLCVSLCVCLSICVSDCLCMSVCLSRCDSGGDCECLCTAVAAFASECDRHGVYVTWRHQHFCRTLRRCLLTSTIKSHKTLVIDQCPQDLVYLLYYPGRRDISQAYSPPSSAELT